MTNEEKNTVDIAVISTEVKNIKEEITAIKNNHLPHIYDRLGAIENKVAYYAVGNAVLLTIIQYFINHR